MDKKHKRYKRKKQSKSPKHKSRNSSHATANNGGKSDEHARPGAHGAHGTHPQHKDKHKRKGANGKKGTNARTNSQSHSQSRVDSVSESGNGDSDKDDGMAAKHSQITKRRGKKLHTNNNGHGNGNANKGIAKNGNSKGNKASDHPPHPQKAKPKPTHDGKEQTKGGAQYAQQYSSILDTPLRALRVALPTLDGLHSHVPTAAASNTLAPPFAPLSPLTPLTPLTPVNVVSVNTTNHGAHGSTHPNTYVSTVTPRLKSILKTPNQAPKAVNIHSMALGQHPLHLSPAFAHTPLTKMTNHNSNWQCSPRHAMTPLSSQTPKNFGGLTPDSPKFLSLSHGHEHGSHSHSHGHSHGVPISRSHGQSKSKSKSNSKSDPKSKSNPQSSPESKPRTKANVDTHHELVGLPTSPQSVSRSRSGSRSVSFDKVEIFEFELCAGQESDGVPSDGGAFSLFLGKAINPVKPITRSTSTGSTGSTSSGTSESSHDDTSTNSAGSQVDIDEYERIRYSKLKERAKKSLNLKKSATDRKTWDEIEKNPKRYLYTAGRNDDFFGSLTVKQRKQIYNKYYTHGVGSTAKHGKDDQSGRNDTSAKTVKTPKYQKKTKNRIPKHEIAQEKKELDKLRESRIKNEIYCQCKPLSKYNIFELKALAQAYNLFGTKSDGKDEEGIGDDNEHHHRRRKGKNKKRHKMKKHVLVDKIEEYFCKVLKINRYSNRHKHIDLCCFDKFQCSCYQYGIDCHSGNGDNDQESQCGCCYNHKHCLNPDGCYNYKTPNYDAKVIRSWENEYDEYSIEANAHDEDGTDYYDICDKNRTHSDNDEEISFTFSESVGSVSYSVSASVSPSQ